MKLNFIITSLLLIFCELSAQESVTLIIETNSKNSMIFINDEFRGNEKVSVEVEEGKNVIAVYERNRGWNSQVIEDTLNVSKDQVETNFSYIFEERILIDSVPQNAKVFESEMLIGYTPFLYAEPERSLSMMKTGFESINNIILKENYSPIRLNFTGDHEPEQFSETVLFHVLMGTAVVLGATTAYLKIQADKKFEKFSESRDKKVLNEVDRYDLYSGISLGLLQINIGYLIYRFVFD